MSPVTDHRSASAAAQKRSRLGGSDYRLLQRPSVNITSVERAGRVLVGLADVISGAVLLSAAGSLFAVALEVLLIATGLDLLVTGALGHCPLYHKLGFTPKSLREMA